MGKLKKIKAKNGKDKAMTDEEARVRMEQFFAELDEKLKDVPKEEIKKGAQKIKDFIDGKVTWADLLNLTQQMRYQLAEHGYAHFQAGRYEDAERVFKILSVLDWKNAYYHAMMGSILQRGMRYGEAAAEYTIALELNPNDIPSLTNRGEILLRFGVIDEAKADLKKAISLDPEKTDRWAERARSLLDKIKEKGN